MASKPMKDKHLADKIDQEDAKLLAKIVERVAAQHDGKRPIQQLSDEDRERFQGSNWQMQGREPPLDEETTLALYLIDAESGASRRFTVTASLYQVMVRQTDRIGYGTTDMEGKHQFKAILQWEKEVRQ